MKVLVACEMSGRVRDAFIARGHDAISADFQLSAAPGPHYWGDVRDILYSENWDLIIAHPPCTYLCCLAGHYVNPESRSYRPKRVGKMYDAATFFKLFLYHPCERVCVENPRMSRFAMALIGQPATQFIEPYMFGDPFSKKTGLWLRGLPPLVADRAPASNVRSWVADRDDKRYRAVHRSLTFPGVARAMAEQWG